MATKVFMEALSPTMEEGRLVKWHKRDGDAVKTGETLAEVETRVKASPLAKRIAKDSGVDLKLVTGSGLGGRVVKRDLEEAGRRERGEVRRAAAQPVVPPEAPLLSPISSAVRGGAAFEDVPLTQIRKTIAKRLATSLGPIPHFFLTTEVDMERAAEARDALNRQHGDRGT